MKFIAALLIALTVAGGVRKMTSLLPDPCSWLPPALWDLYGCSPAGGGGSGAGN